MLKNKKPGEGPAPVNYIAGLGRGLVFWNSKNLSFYPLQ
jgi:hypothetical protein